MTAKRSRDPNQLAKLMIDIEEAEKTATEKRASIAGKKGGPARVASMTREQRSEIARLAPAARWKKS